MACIKSAPRSALAAFAPDAPYLAAGTMAGAVDLSFSSSANLEIFKLDFQSDSQELPVVGACPSSDRFNRLSWGKPKSGSGEYSLGLIAGGLGDGTISLWNPLKLIEYRLFWIHDLLIYCEFWFSFLVNLIFSFLVLQLRAKDLSNVFPFLEFVDWIGKCCLLIQFWREWWRFCCKAWEAYRTGTHCLLKFDAM